MNSDVSVNVNVYSLLLFSVRHHVTCFAQCFKTVYADLYITEEMRLLNFLQPKHVHTRNLIDIYMKLLHNDRRHFLNFLHFLKFFSLNSSLFFDTVYYYFIIL